MVTSRIWRSVGPRRDPGAVSRGGRASASAPGGWPWDRLRTGAAGACIGTGTTLAGAAAVRFVPSSYHPRFGVSEPCVCIDPVQAVLGDGGGDCRSCWPCRMARRCRSCGGPAPGSGSVPGTRGPWRGRFATGRGPGSGGAPRRGQPGGGRDLFTGRAGGAHARRARGHRPVSRRSRPPLGALSTRPAPITLKGNIVVERHTAALIGGGGSGRASAARRGRCRSCRSARGVVVGDR